MVEVAETVAHLFGQHLASYYCSHSHCSGCCFRCYFAYPHLLRQSLHTVIRALHRVLNSVIRALHTVTHVIALRVASCCYCSHCACCCPHCEKHQAHPLLFCYCFHHCVKHQIHPLPFYYCLLRCKTHPPHPPLFYCCFRQCVKGHTQPHPFCCCPRCVKDLFQTNPHPCHSQRTQAGCDLSH